MAKKQNKVIGFRPTDSRMVKRLEDDAKKDKRSISYILNEICNWFYRNYKSIKEVNNV